MSIRRPRGTMSPGELAYVRRQDKHKNARRAQGIRYLVDATPAIEHVRWLHDVEGMTCAEIAKSCDLAATTIRLIYRAVGRAGNPSTMKPRTTVDQVLTAQPLARTTGGAHVPAVGTRRRLQALSAEGFTIPALCEHTGIRVINQLWMLQSGRGAKPMKTVTYAIARTVAEVYCKLAGTDPSDYGVTPSAQARARTFAAKNGHAPSSCWDDDTIDDPDAIAEWTGECGTCAGWLIHRREAIPVCGPCEAADAAGHTNTGTRLVFKPAALYEARTRRTVSRVALAAVIEMTDDSIAGWERGRTQPKVHLVERMAAYLDTPVGDFYEQR